MNSRITTEKKATVIIFAVTSLFIVFCILYAERFLPHTKVVIEGTGHVFDISEKTPREAAEDINTELSEMKFILSGRGLETEFTGEDIELKADIYDELSEFFRENRYNLLLPFTEPRIIEGEVTVSSDKVAGLSERLYENTELTEPEDAVISGHIPEKGYEIIPEKEGNAVEPDVFREFVELRTKELKGRIALTDDVFKSPEIRSDSEELAQRLDRMMLMAGKDLVIRTDGGERIISSEELDSWIIKDQGEPYFDSRLVASKSEALIAEYAEYSEPALDPEGKLVLDADSFRSGFAAALETETHIYDLPLKRVHIDYDPSLGPLYVDISLEKQRVRLFSEGQLILESPCVTGNVRRGDATPPGTFKINYKQRNRILRGEKLPDGSYSYESPVSFWMPFNGGIGLHDATWRGSFGGEIYRNSGSHGCINMPYEKAKELYEKVDAGTVVHVY